MQSNLFLFLSDKSWIQPLKKIKPRRKGFWKGHLKLVKEKANLQCYRNPAYQWCKYFSVVVIHEHSLPQILMRHCSGTIYPPLIIRLVLLYNVPTIIIIIIAIMHFMHVTINAVIIVATIISTVGFKAILKFITRWNQLNKIASLGQVRVITVTCHRNVQGTPLQALQLALAAHQNYIVRTSFVLHDKQVEHTMGKGAHKIKVRLFLPRLRSRYRLR